MIKQHKVKEIGGILLSVSHGKFSFPSSLVFSFDVRSIDPRKSVGCADTKGELLNDSCFTRATFKDLLWITLVTFCPEVNIDRNAASTICKYNTDQLFLKNGNFGVLCTCFLHAS